MHLKIPLCEPSAMNTHLLQYAQTCNLHIPLHFCAIFSLFILKPSFYLWHNYIPFSFFTNKAHVLYILFYLNTHFIFSFNKSVSLFPIPSVPKYITYSKYMYISLSTNRSSLQNTSSVPWRYRRVTSWRAAADALNCPHKEA